MQITSGTFSNHAPLTGPIITDLAPVVAPSAMSGFDAGNYSTRRGYVYYPTLDTKAELQSGTRTEILRRCRYLTRNVGFAKRCIYGIARMTGWLSPVPLTKDKEWNKLAADLFERRYGSSPLGFDVQGRQNFYSYQPLITATRLQDGDFFSVLTESLQGQAMVMSYEAHQVGSFGKPDLRDGVAVNKFNAAQAFNIANGDTYLDGNSIILPARDVIQHADFLSVGHVRGVSALHHAVTHLLDRTELLADLKTGSKIANRQALYVVNQLPQTRSTAPAGMTLATGAPTLATPTQFSMQDLYSEDKPAGKVTELSAGQEIKQLLDQRPHPNTIEFLEYLCRDIAAGLDMAPEVLWNIAKLGGASVRYVMADAQKTIERQQQILVDQFLTRFWVYFVAKEMNAGRLRKCEDPNWYVVGWQPPAKLTVDIGREGRLSIDLHKAGMLTLSKWFGAQGQDWKPEVDQAVEEYGYKVQACNEASARYGFAITPAQVWPEASPAIPQPEVLPALDEANITTTTAALAA
ncbi:MAG: phage portal protein [Caulobacteraceae bacterium]|nr:phage portal protein [Caulobacteraceae bacterium]